MLHSKMLAMLVMVGTLFSSLSTPALANPYTPRQYYGGWNKHPSKNYHYRAYYYKPSPTYSGYKHHYVIYFPSKPTYYYYYNPYSKAYWGRCPVKSEGKGEYSLLAEADRRGSLEEIAEKAFPPMGRMPKMPEATDDATLDLPPDDLPVTSNTP